MTFKSSIIGFMLCFLCFQINGQNSYSEHDIAAQKLLIAAKKEQILGKYDKAIEIYKKLIAEHNELSAAYELSKIYQKKEDYGQAESYGRQAYDRDPKNEWFLIQYCDILAINENHNRAAEVYESFTKVYPYNEFHYLKASYHYLKAERAKEAIKVLDQLEKNNGLSESITQRKFEIYDVLGKNKEALKELESLSKLHPKETKYLHNVAGYLRLMGKENEADKIMLQILKIDPDDETALLFANSPSKNKDANYLKSLVPIIKDQRIEIDKKIIEIIPYLQDFAEKGNPDLGKSLLDISNILDENYPNNAKVKSILGDVYFYSEDLENAVINYNSSIQLDKSIWAVWSQLLLSLNIKKDFKKMESISSDAIDVYPNQATAYYYNGLALLENGNLEEAELSVREAEMIGSNSQSLSKEIKLILSRIELKKKNFESALSLIEKAMEGQEKQNHRFLEHLGDVKAGLNLLPDAKEAWRKAIKAGGNESRIKMKISGENMPN